VITTQRTVTDASTAFETQASMPLSNSAAPSLPASGVPSVPPRKPSMMDHATPAPCVSAFCRATLARLIPKGFWGVGDAQGHNERIFMRNVDRFIRLRRFESLSLHDVTQDMKVRNPDGYLIHDSLCRKTLTYFPDQRDLVARAAKRDCQKYMPIRYT
jgi:Telomerase ribonucleoprotein complex - RNA binding domain